MYHLYCITDASRFGGYVPGDPRRCKPYAFHCGCVQADAGQQGPCESCTSKLDGKFSGLFRESRISSSNGGSSLPNPRRCPTSFRSRKPKPSISRFEPLENREKCRSLLSANQVETRELSVNLMQNQSECRKTHRIAGSLLLLFRDVSFRLLSLFSAHADHRLAICIFREPSYLAIDYSFMSHRFVHIDVYSFRCHLLQYA